MTCALAPVVGRHGSMPVDEAEANLRLFAREVLPAVHDLATTPAGSSG